MTINKREETLIKNTALLSFGMICTKGILFIMTPLFTRWLSLGDYGIYDLLITYNSLIVPIFTLSIGEALFRKVLDADDDYRKTEYTFISIFISIIGIMSVSIILYFISGCFEFNPSVFFFYLLYIIGEIFYSLCVYLLRGLKSMQIYTLGNIIYVFSFSIIVPILVLIFKMGINGLFLSYFLGSTLAVIFMLFYGHLYYYIKFVSFNKKTLKDMLNYSVPMIPNALSWWVINVSDRTLISYFLGVSYNAVYAISNKVPALCSTLFSVFHISWQQSATEALRDDDRDIYYSEVMNKMFIIISSICLVIISINFSFFKFLFPENYFFGVYHAPILVLAIIFSMLAQFIGGIYVARMESKKNAYTTSISAIINIGIGLLLIKHMGLYAASISTLVSYFMLFLIRFFDIRKTIKISFNKKSKIMFIIIIIVTCISYVHASSVQLVLFIFSCIIFAIVNSNYFVKIVRRFFNKR